MRDLVPLYYYIYGTSVDDIEPPLLFLQFDDWWTPLHAWIVDHYPDATWWCVADRPGREGKMKSVWVGTEPPEIDAGDCVHVIRVGLKDA